MSADVIDLGGIYASERGRLRRLVQRLVGNRATAEDLVHQAFLKLLDKADRGDLANCPAYLTTAVKCAKTGYGIQTETIRRCSLLLEKELALFPNCKVLMLMGDVAIKAVNYIAQRAGEERVIPAGSTYKLRGQPYPFRGMRVFPSYLQAGPSFFIEKAKRRMIAEDISAALRLVPAA